MKRYNVFQTILMGFTAGAPAITWFILAVFFLVLAIFPANGHLNAQLALIFVLLVWLILAGLRWKRIVFIEDYKTTDRLTGILLRKGADGKVEAGKFFWRRRGDQFSSIRLPPDRENHVIVCPFAFGKDCLPKGVSAHGEVQLMLSSWALTDKNFVEGFTAEELWELSWLSYHVELALGSRFLEGAINDPDVQSVLGRGRSGLDTFSAKLHNALIVAKWLSPKYMASDEIYLTVTQGRRTTILH